LHDTDMRSPRCKLVAAVGMSMGTSVGGELL
jgi:hypothetical protein